MAFVAVAGGLDDRETLRDQALLDEVGGDLVLDPGPDLVGVDEGERGLPALGPGTKQQSGLTADRVARSLGAGVVGEVMPEVVLEDGLQVPSDPRSGLRTVDTVDPGHPRPDHAIGDAARAVLVLRALPLEQLLDFPALPVDARDEVDEGGVAQPPGGDLLVVILPVVEMLVEVGRTFPGQVAIEGLVVRVADVSREVGHGRECTEIDAGAHAVGPPELDVVGVVVRLFEDTAMAGIPGLDAVVDALLDAGVKALHPPSIARDLPVAVELHDPAELSVASGVEPVVGGAVWKRGTEVDVAAPVHAAPELLLAKGPLELGVEMGDGLGVVPDVGAAPRTTPLVGEATLPRPQVAVLLAKHRGRLEDREVRRHGVEHVRGQCGREQGVVEGLGTGAKGGVVLPHVKGNGPGVLPLGCVEGPPSGRRVGLTASVAADLTVIDSACRVVAVGEVPGDHDGVGDLLAGLE